MRAPEAYRRSARLAKPTVACGSAKLDPPLQVGKGRPDDLLGGLPLDPPGQWRVQPHREVVGDPGAAVYQRFQPVGAGQVLEGSLHVGPRHPGVAGLLKTRDPLGPHSLALAEAFLSPLQTAGFGDREAGLAFFLLVDYTIGFAISSPRTSVNEQRVRDTAISTQLHEFFRTLPPDRFPTLVALGEHVWVDNRNERFTAGLDALVAGLEHAHNSPSDPS